MMKDYKSIIKPNQRGKTPRFTSTSMFMALMIWICALPLLALVVAPLLGWQVAVFLAGFLLIVDTIVCWLLCAVKVPRAPAVCAKCLKRLNATGSTIEKSQVHQKIVSYGSK